MSIQGSTDLSGLLEDSTFLPELDRRKMALGRIDPQRRIVEMAPAQGHICDLELGELAGSDLFEVFPELESAAEEVRALFADEQPEVLLEQIGGLDPSGDDTYRTMRLLPHHDDEGSLDGALLVVIDVTHQVKLEQEIVQAHNDLHLLNIRLDEQRNRLGEQTAMLRGIMTTLIPKAIEELEGEARATMVTLLWDAVLESVHAAAPRDDATAAQLDGAIQTLASTLNALGGQFELVHADSSFDDPAVAEASALQEGKAVIIGTSCPWGVETARANPALCTVTEGLFLRGLKEEFPELEGTLDLSMAKGAPCCRVVLQTRSGQDEA